MAANRKRNRPLSIYLLDEEYEILEAKKDEANLTKSDFIRNLILFGAAHERTVFSRDAERALIRELNKIGTNLNQIAVRANSNKIVDDRDFQALYNNYKELLGAYDMFIRGKSNGDY